MSDIAVKSVEYLRLLQNLYEGAVEDNACIERLAELKKWCTELVHQRPMSPEWNEAMTMIGQIVTEKESP